MASKQGPSGNGSAFSFFPTKNLGAMGDGGLFVTDCDEAAHSALKLRNHGGIDKYSNDELGYNSRLDSIQAAILSVKLKYLDKYNTGRREVAARYNELLAGIDGVITPEVCDGHVFHQYTVRITNASRDEVHASMMKAGVGCMIYYPTPQDLLPVYGLNESPHKASAEAAAQVMSLPIWPELGLAVQEHVTDVLSSCI
jgi:dTDP-4-amino-4,6-dideoxygalactose transaminase